MKKIILFALSIGLFVLPSCDDENEPADNPPQLSLAGKVYGLRAKSFEATCWQPFAGTVHLPRLLFLDSRSFIKIIPGDCDDLGRNFLCLKNYCGTYKMEDGQLILAFEPTMVTQYLKLKIDTLSKKSPFITTHLEPGASDMITEKLMKGNCNGNPYFELCDAHSHLMLRTSDTLTNHIKYLIDETIWQKLFGIN
jgi:hypothetical protein